MNKDTKFEDLTFDELVEEATRRIHSALLDGGGKEMKSKIFLYMSSAIQWSQAQDKKKK